MATNPTVEGDGTALYISNLLAELAVRDHAAGAGDHHRQRARICQQGDPGRRPGGPAEVLDRERRERLIAGVARPRRSLRSLTHLMRLSFGQELRLVQKQVLAPRMIQSMEILQLPILALQERIEQEMQENPGAGDAGGGSRPARGAGRGREPRRADRGRARAGDRRDQEQRGRFRAAAEDGRGVARPLRGALAAVAARASRRKASASTTRWPTWSPGRSRCKTICTISWAGSTWSRACGRWPTGSSTTSTPMAICRGGWKTCSGPTPRPSELALAQRALAVVQKLDPPGVGGPRPARVPAACNSRRACRYYEQLQTLISNHLEDLEHNRLPVIERQTGYSIELIQEALVRAAQAESQAGRRLRRRARAHGHARRVRRAGRGRQVPGAAGRRPHAQPVHQPLLSQAAARAARPTTRPASTSSGRSTRPSG